jgi:hypothetical protein
MWRVMGLALLFVLAAAVPAAAKDGRDAAGNSARLAARDAASGSETRPGGAVVGLAGPKLLASPSPRRSAVRAPGLAVGVAGLAAARLEPREWIVLPWLSQGLALPLTERFSLGVDYQNVRGEDLWQEFAETGSMDYDSHNFILRAHWRF